MVTIEEARAAVEAAREDITTGRESATAATESVASTQAQIEQSRAAFEAAKKIPKAELYRPTGMVGVQARREKASLIKRGIQRLKEAFEKTTVRKEEIAKYLEEAEISEEGIKAYEGEISEVEAANIAAKEAYDKEEIREDALNAADEAQYQKD